MDELVIQQKRDGICFRVQVAPRSSRATVMGVHNGALKVSLTAPPVQGAANRALLDLLAHKLKLPKRSIHIIQGQRSKTKTIEIQGTDIDKLRALVVRMSRC